METNDENRKTPIIKSRKFPDFGLDKINHISPRGGRTAMKHLEIER